MCTCAREGRHAARAAASPSPVPAPGPPPPPGPRVAMTFVGQHARLVRGSATGAGYAGYPNERLDVHPDDAASLVGSGFFVTSA